MKISRFTDSQIMQILNQAKAGISALELCREHGMSSATFYKWRAKYGGMDASMVSRLKELEDENRRLKKMVAEVQLQADVLKEAMAKVVKPSSRREMAAAVAKASQLSIRAACVWSFIYFKCPASVPWRINKKSPHRCEPYSIWWPGTESNCRHADFQSAALPTELPGQRYN
jgi:putative transposase